MSETCEIFASSHTVLNFAEDTVEGRIVEPLPHSARVMYGSNCLVFASRATKQSPILS